MSDSASRGAPAQRATKHDVELAKIESEERKSVRRFRLWTQITRGTFLAVYIAAAWVPLQGVRAIVGDVAGRQTTFDAYLNVSLGVSVALAISLAVSVSVNIERKKKVKRQRERMDDLEKRLGIRELQRGGATR